MILRGATAQKAGRVLVISADPEITRILEVNLSHAKLEVVSAQSGTEALQKIHSSKLDIIILDPALPDIENEEIQRQIQEAPRDIPFILLSPKPKKRNKGLKVENITVDYVSKPFDPKEVVRLVQGYLTQGARKVNIDTLTGLPNRSQVEKEISRLIDVQTAFAVVYIAMHDFKAVNRAYGYDQGDRIIRLLADIVSEAVRLFGNPEDLAAHFSGDKFVVVSTPWKARTLCRRIIADYNRRIKSLVTDEHLQTGHAALGSPSDREHTPIMSIHIATVTNQKRTFHHHVEVIEYAAEQIEYLKNSPESNCYFDLKLNGFEPPLTLPRRDTVQANKDELKAVQAVLAWLDFLTGEIITPLAKMQDTLNSLESKKTENLSHGQLDSFKSLQESCNHLARVAEGIAGLAKSERLSANTLIAEVDLGDTIDWVMGQVQLQGSAKGIKTDIVIAGDVSRILVDKRSLTQSVFHIIKSEIRSAPQESHLHIRVAEKNAEFINVEISNPDHYISSRTLNNLLQGQPVTAPREIFINELYPARVLIESLGGKLEVTTEKGTGTTYRITVPKKWQSWMSEVNNLQLAMDISRKEARDTLKNVQRLVSLHMPEVPPVIRDACDRMGSKVQELSVLGNRALYLADDFNSKLEIQQDRLLQQEAEQMATSEAILTISREMVRSLEAKHLFDLESAKRTAKYALSIGKEFQISESERQALLHAALLKDIALAFSRPDIIEQMALTSRGMVAPMKARLNLVWKALATIPFFSSTSNLLLYRYERYDGTGGSFGIKGGDIPLGSRILAVADAFEFLTSGRSPQGKLTPARAVEKMVADSGLRYDPHVVSAFLMLWKRNELLM